MKQTPAKLQVRIDRDLKDSAEEVFAAIGLDATTAVRIFFTKVAATRSIPFALKAEPEFTSVEEERILAAAKEAEDPDNLIGPFSSAVDLIESLRNPPVMAP